MNDLNIFGPKEWLGNLVLALRLTGDPSMLNDSTVLIFPNVPQDFIHRDGMIAYAREKMREFYEASKT